MDAKTNINFHVNKFCKLTTASVIISKLEWAKNEIFNGFASGEQRSNFSHCDRSYSQELLVST